MTSTPSGKNGKSLFDAIGKPGVNKDLMLNKMARIRRPQGRVMSRCASTASTSSWVSAWRGRRFSSLGKTMSRAGLWSITLWSWIHFIQERSEVSQCDWLEIASGWPSFLR